MDALNIYSQAAILIFIYLNICYIFAMYLRDNSIVDICWGMGFVILANYFAITNGFLNPVLLVVVTIWGLRLSLYLLLRYFKKGPDWRYEKWKKEWGRHYLWRSYLQVYILQGFFLFIVSVPVVYGSGFAFEFSIFSLVGIFLFFFGFFFETLADHQLMRFKSDESNKGKVLDKGLWRYSRHPNYFGETVLWWGIFLIVLPSSSGWWIVIGPITITWLLMKVSGVPMLERKKAKEPKYQDYIQKTSTFFPWVPKK